MKRPLFLLLAIALVTALVVLWQQPQRLPQADAQDDLFFPDYDARRVMRVEIAQQGEGVQLKKNGEDWQVAPLGEELWFPADRSRINAALGIFGDVERGILVSSNPEKQKLYQVGAEGLQLKLFAEHDLLMGELVIGKNGPDFGSSYVRLAAENDVYLVGQSLLGIFSIAADDWKIH